MTSKTLTISTVATYAILTNSAFALVPPLEVEETNELDPIVITSDFREKKLSQTNNSVSIIGEEEIYDKATEPFAETISSIPNVNFSSGASKGKYIQIRGIGERSQFTTPINPSVGINVDGIDFSNTSLGVSSFDVEQIEVLKGPQGTSFGANAMGGVINVQSKAPTKETEGHIEATVGNYNTKAFGVAIGGSLIEEKLLGRVSLYKNTSDGFIENDYLNREDTNNIDEMYGKMALQWLVNDANTIDLNLMHVKIDNGYDAFNFTNDRTTYSDMPGKDEQDTKAGSIKITSQINSKMHLESKFSHSKSDMKYSFDEDWSYVGEFTEQLAILNAGLNMDDLNYIWPYNYFDEYNRDREQNDFDIRLVSDEKVLNGSTDWTIGAYVKHDTEDLTRNRLKETVPSTFTSNYKTRSNAIYGQMDSEIMSKLTLVTGLRVEKWEAKYRDSDAVKIDTDETLVGGKVGLEYQQDENTLHYITLSKGYKPGGVNADNSFIATAREYKTETLWNLDMGRTFSGFDNRFKTRLNAFYGKRKEQQVKSSIAGKDEEGKPSFTEYIANAGKAHYYGVETEFDYYPNDTLHLFANIGILKAKFDEYQDPNPDSVDMEGRSPAMSPEYQYSIGGDVMVTDSLIFKANVEGKDAYYFSNIHNEKSKVYALLNSSLEYSYKDWTAILWARNITDEEYQTRGFSFENNPANSYEPELYTQQGSPRTIGATMSYDF
ncbi:TonB-dependent receptor [Sulfurovum sp. bin170]|uniref:TonB-dependent receptor n=1 Tax=Sulfurovum sp. bin170 TaxID=2695268 RepID=UPI0013DE9692|nr:TonB-dependent receptor [Sulfurovum sp. bin170]NEW60856.1 TonB-dependent receptor [Sulfurovum sp. bin170]